MPVIVKDFEVVPDTRPENAARPEVTKTDKPDEPDFELRLKQQHAREQRARAY